MKTTRVLMLMLALLAFSTGSYASACYPKNPKAMHDAAIHATPLVSLASNVSYPLQFAVLPAQFVFDEKRSYFVPVAIGKVVNKPISNFKYKGFQHYFSCNGSFDC